MKYYSIELIDVNENIENFKFNKISEKDLEKILGVFRQGGKGLHLEFSSIEGEVLLQAGFFRGLMYTDYVEPPKTLIAETLENSVEISKIDIPRR